jgi:PAS domain S-box-containing protein
MSAEKKKTILLVEDEAITAMAEKSALEKYGYKVITAHNGTEAIEKAKAMTEIDLILMDINLGSGIDGTEAAEIILRQRDLPVVFLSSHMEPEVVEKTEKITSYGYVVKDSSITVLDASIKMAFKLFASHEEIRKNEERQQLILAALPIAIFTSPLDPEVDTSWVSGDVEKVTGFSVEQYLAEKDFWRSRLHADDRKRVLAAYKNPAAGDEIVLEYRWLCKDGNYKWFYDRSIKKRYPQGTQYVGIILDITENKRAEFQREAALEDLRNSEDKFRSLTENINLGIYRNTVGPEGKFIEANHALIGMFGYASKEEFLAVNVSELYQKPDDRNIFNAKMLQEGFVRGEELCLKRKDGGFFIGSVSALAVKDEQGHVKYYDGIIDDITERKQMESQRAAALEALQVSLEKYRVLFESFPLGITISDKSGKIMEGNIQAQQLLGITRDVQTQRRIDGKEWQIIRKDGTPMPAAEYASTRALQENRLIKNVEMGIVKDKGEITWISVTAAPIPLEDYGVAITYSDITEHKRTESQKEAALEALRESEKELQHLFKSMINAFVLFESIFDDGGNFISYRFVYINEAYERITGVKNEDVKGKSVHEVWPETEAEWIRRYGEVAVTGVSSEFELYHDPTKKLYHCNVYRPWNEKSRFCVVFEDITGRKQAEETLRKSEGKFRAIFNNASDGMFIIDLKTRKFLMCNTMCAKMLGYNQEELSNLNVADIHPGEDLPFIYEQIGKFSREEEGIRSDIRFKRKNGSIFESDLSPALLTFAEEKNLLIIFKDITARKQAEEEIKRQLAEKEILLKEVHHRIKNNIASIAGLISLRLQSITNPEAITVLQEAIGRIDNMRLLYDTLLLSEGRQDIPMKNYVESLAAAVVSLFPGQAKITLDLRVDDFHLDAKRLFLLGIIINELLTNIMKYAFTNRKTGRIEIALTLVKKHVIFTVQDDGRGLPAGFELDKSKGFGLMLVKMLSQQLGGSFSMAKRKGTRCTLKFDV